MVRQQVTVVALGAAESFVCAHLLGVLVLQNSWLLVCIWGAAVVFFLTGFSVCSSGDYEVGVYNFGC